MGQFLELIVDKERIPYPWKESILYYRRIPGNEVERIKKKWTVTKGKNPRTGEPRKETNDVEVDNDIFDYILIDWDDVCLPGKNEDGSNILAPCTREMKMAVPLEIRGDLINRAMAGDKESEEEEKKTSETTPNS